MGERGAGVPVRWTQPPPMYGVLTQLSLEVAGPNHSDLSGAEGVSVPGIDNTYNELSECMVREFIQLITGVEFDRRRYPCMAYFSGTQTGQCVGSARSARRGNRRSELLLRERRTDLSHRSGADIPGVQRRNLSDATRRRWCRASRTWPRQYRSGWDSLEPHVPVGVGTVVVPTATIPGSPPPLRLLAGLLSACTTPTTRTVSVVTLLGRMLTPVFCTKRTDPARSPAPHVSRGPPGRHTSDSRWRTRPARDVAGGCGSGYG